MSFVSRAPTRIDLAGGTLDIWPLYLLLERAATVNIAVDLFAEVSLAPSAEGWRIHNRDEGQELDAGSLEELELLPGAEIAGNLLRFFEVDDPLKLETRSMAPPRSGLGASSALGIAIAGTLNALTGLRYDGYELIEIVKNVEARVLRAMTGTQDHFPAVFGGASCLWWQLDRPRREALPVNRGAFEERFVLAYTHQPHRSGANNWQVVKRFLDGEPETRKALETIARIARDMRRALLEGDLDAMALLIGEEWEARRRLAPEVSSPEIEQLLQAAVDAGAQCGKACGAGGGGCLLLAVPLSSRVEVETAIRDAGGTALSFRVAPRGLELGGSIEPLRREDGAVESGGG